MNTLEHIDVYYPGLNYVGRMWVDPLIHLVLNLFGQSGSLNGYLLCQCLVLLIGSVFLCRELSASKKEALMGALCIVISCFACVGFDPYLLAMHWFPALAATLIQFRNSTCLKNMLLSFLVAILWLMSCGPLVLLGSLMALAMASIPNVVATSKPKPIREAREHLPYFAVIACILFVGSIVAIPVYEMPQYADAARVAPISPFTFRGAPSIGPWLNPMTLVWSSYQQTNWIFSLKFSVVCLILCVVMACYRRWSWRTASLLALFLGAVVLESTLKGAASLYTPFQTLWRLIPGVGVADLPWMIVPFGLIVAISVGAHRLGVKCLSTVFLLILVFISSAETGVLGMKALRATPELKSKNVAGSSYFGSKMAQSQDKRYELSPSGFVIDSFGEWVIEAGASKRSFKTLERLVQGQDFEARTSASINDAGAFRAIDNDANTRWNTGRPQKVGDTFALEFSAPVALARVVLSVKSVPADFPRGIRVRASADCGDRETLIDQSHWHGPVMWTQAGYPYFGAQSWVILDFPKQLELKCLDFELQDGHPVFDWSIDEVKLYRFKSAQ